MVAAPFVGTTTAAAKAAESAPTSGFSAGDCVQVSGLDSESGRPLNGQTGIITGLGLDGGRVEVQLAAGGQVNLKPSNLKKLEFQPVDCVEVIGLTSDEGRKINGKVGVIVRFIYETARYEVHFASGQRANFKPGNLRRPSSNPSASASQAQVTAERKPKEKVADALSPAVEKCESSATAAEGGSESAASHMGKDNHEEPQVETKVEPEEVAVTSASGKKGQGRGHGRGGRPRKEAQQAGETKAEEERKEPELHANEQPKGTTVTSAVGKARGRGRGRGRGRPREEAQEPRGVARAEEECEDLQGEPTAKRMRSGEATTQVEESEAKTKIGKSNSKASEQQQQQKSEDAPKPAEGEANVEDDTPDAQQATSSGHAPATPKSQRKRKAAKAGEEEQPNQTDGISSGVKCGRPKQSQDAAQPAKIDEKENPSAAALQRRGRAGKAKMAAATAPRLDEKVLAEAEALGMSGALRNLASRDVIIEQGLSAAALLRALQQADGLVNKAKTILLSST